MSTATLEPAAAHANRRSRPFAWIEQSLTLAWRNIVRIRQNPEALADVTFQPIIFLLLFLFVFGGAIASGGTWHDYLPYLLPGLLVQTVVFSTMGTGVGLNDDFAKGVFDRFRSLPIARTSPLAGRILADTVKQAWSMFVLLGMGILIGFRIETNAFAVVAAFFLLLAFALLVSWASVFIGLSVREPEKVQIFGFTIIFPLSFLSTAFIKLSPGTPDWLAFVMRNNPVTQLVEATRGLLLGGPVAAHATIALAWGAAMAALFIPLSIWQFRRRV